MWGVSPSAQLSPTHDLRDLSYSVQLFGLKAQKPQAQGKANNVSRHPGWTMPRMVRPTGAKATKRRKEKGDSRKQKEPCGVFLPMLHFPTSRHQSFCSFRAHFPYTSTQGAVPVELALGYVLSAPLGRAPHNHNPSLPSPHRPCGWFL